LDGFVEIPDLQTRLREAQRGGGIADLSESVPQVIEGIREVRLQLYGVLEGADGGLHLSLVIEAAPQIPMSNSEVRTEFDCGLWWTSERGRWGEGEGEGPGRRRWHHPTDQTP
jgi:hypothetical protein